jgi:hypothetical protein
VEYYFVKLLPAFFASILVSSVALIFWLVLRNSLERRRFQRFWTTFKEHDEYNSMREQARDGLQDFPSMTGDDLRIAQLTSRLGFSPKAIYLLKLLVRRSVQQYEAYEPFDYKAAELAVRQLNRWGDQEYSLRDVQTSEVASVTCASETGNFSGVSDHKVPIVAVT